MPEVVGFSSGSPVYQRQLFYTLDKDHHIIPCETALQAETMLSDVSLRRVGENIYGDTRVSTVFLCIDHNHTGIGPPLLFETMIFSDDKDLDGYCVRVSTWDEAVKSHADAVKLVLDNKRGAVEACRESRRVNLRNLLD